MLYSPRDRLRLLFGFGGLTLTACGGGGTNSTPAPVVTPPPSPPPVSGPDPLSQSVRDAWSSEFLVGAAIQAGMLNNTSGEYPLITEQYSSLTAEFEMKAAEIASGPGQYDFSVVDQIVDFAEANNLEVRGHALLWYRSTPDYMLGVPATTMRDQLEDFISTYVGRYAGRITAWDVVNEPTTDDENDVSAPYRNDDWFAGAGKDYLDWAFNAARAADPSAKLFINDYNTELAGKRGRYVTIIRDLLDRGIPLDGVGHQMHIGFRTPIANVEAALNAIDDLNAGLEQHITELDISVYNDPGSCFASGVSCAPDYGSDLANVPADVQRQQMDLYRDIFNAGASRDSVTSITMWGVSDARTWLDTWPVTRSNHPLLFDRDYNPKPPAYALTDPDYEFSG